MKPTAAVRHATLNPYTEATEHMKRRQALKRTAGLSAVHELPALRRPYPWDNV